MKVRGVEKIAAVLLGLERGTAALLLKDLPDEPLEAITQAMVELSAKNFTIADAEPTLEEFYQRLGDGSAVVNNFQDLLTSALGENRAKAHVQKLASSRERSAPLGLLEQLPPGEVADVLMDEHDQVCAVALASMRPKAAARILEEFSSEARTNMLKRVASLETPAPDLVAAVGAALIERLGPARPSSEPESGLNVAASILNFMEGEAEQEVAEVMQGDDMQLYQAIDEQRVTMEDLTHIDKRSMQKVLAGIDARVLTVALKGASKPVENSILDNVSKRSRDNIMEERELLGAVPVLEVKQARQSLLSVVREMVKKGELVLNRAGGDDVVE